MFTNSYGTILIEIRRKNESTLVLSCEVLKGNPADSTLYKGTLDKINDWELNQSRIQSLLQFDPVTTDKTRRKIISSRWNPTISEMGYTWNR